MEMVEKLRARLGSSDRFEDRHIGPDEEAIREMLEVVGFRSLEALVEATIPASIRMREPLALPRGRSEEEMLAEARRLAEANDLRRSYVGMGYHRAVVPPVILRNVLENPGWYTQYTPYQAEISQGRLEALLTFQTMVADLTGLPIANASLLDEGTAAAEAMSVCYAAARGKRSRFVASSDCHPQTLAVVETRAEPLGIRVERAAYNAISFDDDTFGVLVPYPATDGTIHTDLAELCQRAHEAGAMVVVAADLLALTLLVPPGRLGADVAIGSTQRFGVPMGYGGPHAAYFSTTEEHKRRIPGRVVGVSRDRDGREALRLALQTREQHIRRDKATSNICTSQVLLAVMAAMYAVYHGPKGLRAIAARVHQMTEALRSVFQNAGLEVGPQGPVFDTLWVRPHDAAAVLERAEEARLELRRYDDGRLGLTLDEAADADSLLALLQVFTGERDAGALLEALGKGGDGGYEGTLGREPGGYLTHPVFHSYHAEHEMLRYLHRLQARDLSMTTSMIPLGSCTMKLNAAAEMIPVTLPGFAQIHPFSPPERNQGYLELIEQLEGWLAENHGAAGGVAAAQCRQPRGVRRSAVHPLLSPGPRRARSRRLPDPQLGPRHQPGQRGDGRDAGRGRGLRRAG